MRAGNFLKTFGKNRFSVGPLGFAPDWAVLVTRSYDDDNHSLILLFSFISARKLAEVAGHGILIVWERGDVASQCVSKYSCCRDLHPGRQIRSLLLIHCEKKTHVSITLPSTNFRTI